jgi:hypothetical protein
MGCSSGRLRQHGQYEPWGAAAALAVAGARPARSCAAMKDPALLRFRRAHKAHRLRRPIPRPACSCAHAGCPAVVANLWDVTDRDIDRFGLALLRAWRSVTAQQAASAMPAPSASRSMGGQAAAVTSLVEGGEEVEGAARRLGLGAAVADSRGACKLRSLVGAAPVCFGLPPPP